MTGDADPAWTGALLAVALFAVDPHGIGGMSVRARPGPVRDRLVARLRALLPAGTALRTLPAHAGADRLLGGLDLAATLHAGRRVAERGLLAQADGGVVLVPMAERLEPGPAAYLGVALDHAEIVVERDGVAMRAPARIGVVALDEGAAPDEAPPVALTDRLALHLDLDAVSVRALEITPEELPPAAAATAAEVAAARARLPGVTMDETIARALCAAALALGVVPLRASLLAGRVACAAAALAGRAAVTEEDAAMAARLVLAPRATTLPAPPEESEDDAPPPEPESAEAPDAGAQDDTEDAAPPDQPPDDMVLEAAVAAVPEGLLDKLRMAAPVARTRTSGAGAAARVARRGRPVGTRVGDPRGGARLDVLATLRTAAPWQGLRRAAASAANATPPARLRITRDDFRITRFRQRTRTTTIFVVDASGSSALNRLAEAKGAVELLLADCYVRRDQVALLSFRGTAATMLLPPTGSLVRAKRGLAAMAGGGGTPLATALDAAALLADQVRRRGETPAIVLLTDGRANVARDGTGGRAAAAADALASARALGAMGHAAVLIDTSRLPQPAAEEIARAMGALYVPLPLADAARLSRAVRAAMPGDGRSRPMPGDGRSAA